MSQKITTQKLDLFLNKPELFDQAVHGNEQIRALPCGATITMVTKDDSMLIGPGKKAASVVIAFDVQTPDGTICRAQYATSLRMLKGALQALDARYDDDGTPRIATGDSER